MTAPLRQTEPAWTAAGEPTCVTSPVLPGGAATLVRRIPAADLHKAWHGNLGIDIRPFLQSIPEIDLYACDRTGLHFFRPAGAAGPGELYERLQSFPWYYASHKWEYTAALDRCAGARRVLEIGCAEGSFLDACRARGIDATGVELNARAAKVARHRGHAVLMRPLSELVAEQAGSWDAACAFQVLEHVPDPGRFFDDLLALVRPGGRLLLAVPNRDSFIRHDHAEHGVPLDTPPHHMSRWNADVFRRLADLRGVAVESILYEPLAASHITHWINVQCRRLRRRRVPGERIACSRPLRRAAAIALRLGLRLLIRGQTLLVVLRRP